MGKEKRLEKGGQIKEEMLTVPWWGQYELNLTPGREERKKGCKGHLKGSWQDLITGSGGAGVFCHIKKQRSYRWSYQRLPGSCEKDSGTY